LKQACQPFAEEDVVVGQRHSRRAHMADYPSGPRAECGVARPLLSGGWHNPYCV
jgi:hypothetical protein